MVLVFIVKMVSYMIWCDGSLDQSFMVDSVNYFSFQPVLHNCCIKGCDMCYPVCGMVHIKRNLAANRKE